MCFVFYMVFAYKYNLNATFYKQCTMLIDLGRSHMGPCLQFM